MKDLVKKGLGLVAVLGALVAGVNVAQQRIEVSVHDASKAVQVRQNLFHDQAVDVYQASLKTANEGVRIGVVLGGVSVMLVTGVYGFLKDKTKEKSITDPAVTLALQDIERKLDEIRYSAVVGEQLQIKFPEGSEASTSVQQVSDTIRTELNEALLQQKRPGGSLY